MVAKSLKDFNKSSTFISCSMPNLAKLAYMDDPHSFSYITPKKTTKETNLILICNDTPSFNITQASEVWTSGVCTYPSPNT
jgi:hypothetical protein